MKKQSPGPSRFHATCIASFVSISDPAANLPSKCRLLSNTVDFDRKFQFPSNKKVASPWHPALSPQLLNEITKVVMCKSDETEMLVNELIQYPASGKSIPSRYTLCFQFCSLVKTHSRGKGSMPRNGNVLVIRER